MGDAYRKFGIGNLQQVESILHQVLKRPRLDLEMPSGHNMSGYYARDDERAGHLVTRDTDIVNASYERYLRSVPNSSSGGEAGRSVGGFDGLHEIDDLRVLASGGLDPVVAAPSRFMGAQGSLGGSNPAATAQSRFMGVGRQPEIRLPPEASSTLFVEGLPTNCTRREVSHIFRPFVGYKEVRLVTKGPRHSGGEPVVLCFVDFESPAHAATAMDALQGYTFDEHDRDSGHLRIQFARSPGARGGGHHGKR